MLSQREIGWVAGFLEGEGYFGYRGTPRIYASQVQREPLDRLERMFGGRVTLGVTSQGRPIHNWHASGVIATGLMFMLYPLLSPRRQAQVRVAIHKWRAARPHHRYKTACPKGHPYDRFTVAGKRHRRCTTCINASQRLRAPKYRARINERRRELKRLLKLVPSPEKIANG